MGNPAGVRRDFEKLEERRLLGARLLRQGVHPAEVARQVGVHRQSVSRWAAQLKQGGVRALRKAGHAGRRARLRPAALPTSATSVPIKIRHFLRLSFIGRTPLE